MGFCKVSNWESSCVVGGRCGGRCASRLSPPSSPGVQRKPRTSPKDLLLKVAGVRAGDLCPDSVISDSPQPGACCGIEFLLEWLIYVLLGGAGGGGALDIVVCEASQSKTAEILVAFLTLEQLTRTSGRK